MLNSIFNILFIQQIVIQFHRTTLFKNSNKATQVNLTVMKRFESTTRISLMKPAILI